MRPDYSLKSTQRVLLFSFGIPLFICLFSILSSCRHDTDLTNIPDVKFTEVQGLLSGSCGSSDCHGDNSEEFSLIGYENVMENGDVKEGNASGSKLYKVLIETGEDKMPPDPRSPLTDDNIKKIYIWIEQGAKNN